MADFFRSRKTELTYGWNESNLTPETLGDLLNQMMTDGVPKDADVLIDNKTHQITAKWEAEV
jgi:hypothetical protein